MATAQQILGSTQHTLSHTTADGRFALLRGAALAGVFVGKFDRVSTGLGTPHLQDLHPRSAGVSSITPEEHRTALGVTFRTLARPTSTHNRVGNLPQQSDVCDVTFPKNDCCSLSPYNTLACAHSFPFFPFFSGGPLLLYPYRTGDDDDDEDEDISELPAESGVVSSLLLSSSLA